MKFLQFNKVFLKMMSMNLQKLRRELDPDFPDLIITEPLPDIDIALEKMEFNPLHIKMDIIKRTESDKTKYDSIIKEYLANTRSSFLKNLDFYSSSDDGPNDIPTIHIICGNAAADCDVMNKALFSCDELSEKDLRDNIGYLDRQWQDLPYAHVRAFDRMDDEILRYNYAINECEDMIAKSNDDIVHKFLKEKIEDCHKNIKLLSASCRALSPVPQSRVDRIPPLIKQFKKMLKNKQK